MFNNESVVKSIAGRVFPGMSKFSDGVAKLDVWDVYLTITDEITWLTVELGFDVLFQIEACGGYVTARYALPVIVKLGNGEKRYGTAWAGSRCWCVGGWSDISPVATSIREFFNNTNELFEEEEEKILKELDN